MLRNLVVALLHSTGHDALAETARLLTSEIVTNVYLHTKVPAIHVEVIVAPQQVHVYVRDNEPRCQAMPPEVRDGEGGLGLYLMNKYADAWGITHYGGMTPTGEAVWFRLVECGKAAS
ncbi:MULTISPECIES: ATP-binding protein [unclassified Streptomyces]|uniref:ATP-binding protein n=1 Tax=unclassified Streptomyces TaxID=2593676 RepID=UPI0033E032EE